MKTPILTAGHEFHAHGQYSVLSAEPGVPVHVSLEAATLILESVVSGLQELMSIPEASNSATLICYAADSALALVYAAQAGAATQFEESESVARKSEADHV